MKKINERYHHLCLTVSTAAAVMSFMALAISLAALIKSCKRSRVTTTEYDCCNFDEDDDTLAF